MMRFLAYTGTLLGIMLVVAIVLHILVALMGVQLEQAELGTVLVVSLLYGMAGSAVSLFMSKYLIKKTYRLTPIAEPRNATERWLVDTVSSLAEKKKIGMPEVCIYNSRDMNAFATGWNKNNALVAVSTALLENMSKEEVEAVLGHEITHVENGDMVTMSLVQGVVSSFVYFIAFIVARLVAARVRGAQVLVFRLVHLLTLWTVGFAGQFVVLAFSRWREFRADAGSAEVLGAEPMIKALETLKTGYAVDRAHTVAGDNSQKEPTDDKNTSMLCISDREMAGIFGDWTRSHPSLQKRIEVLKERRN